MEERTWNIVQTSTHTKNVTKKTMNKKSAILERSLSLCPCFLSVIENDALLLNIKKDKNKGKKKL
jgi:hypothetical protein